MGFEIKLYIVAKTDHEWSREIALTVGTFDLCKPGYESAICKLHSEGACNSVQRGVYRGDEGVKEDCYGDELWAHPIADVIQALESDAHNDEYWRFTVALSFLKEIEKHWDYFGEPYVITFGH